jgi:hypothetical protein
MKKNLILLALLVVGALGIYLLTALPTLGDILVMGGTLAVGFGLGCVSKGTINFGEID